MSLLEIENLNVQFSTGKRTVHAVSGVDLRVRAGESLALVGESGSGKTVTALSILGLTPPAPTCRVGGEIRFSGQNLLGLSESRLKAVRGGEVAMVFQDPTSALNPLLTVGTQITDAVQSHLPGRRRRDELRGRAVEALELAALDKPLERLRQYPHQLSGGMRQRAAIALAIAARPRLLIADEPTTALDVTVQGEIMETLGRLRRELDMALVLVTHDLGVVAEHSDRTAVMYAGRIVEQGPTQQVLANPQMPYTRALLDATPLVGAPPKERLRAIGGAPPDLADLPEGCAFSPRCPYAIDICRTTVPELTRRGPDRVAACIRTDNGLVINGTKSPIPASFSTVSKSSVNPASSPKVLARFTDVALHYPVRGGLLGRKTGYVPAVDGVSLDVYSGNTLAVVGESGSGKTSLSRTLLRLEKPTAGLVTYDGIDVSQARGRDLARLQREVQVVFQSPYASLDPRMTIQRILAEPLRVHGEPVERDRLARLLESVGLGEDALDRYPAAFSGGQRQRIAIARAVSLRPRLIVCDEAVSALDVSVQAQVLNLLGDLQAEHGIAYLFITHDLGVVRSVADEVAVMQAGQVVEYGPAERVYAQPKHNYTRELLANAPRQTAGAL
ncbi:dipeptide ABC transporter ATP-binding protein [Nesterenkonia ebinurensis]|uniref:dipeptide ABC transporter ATP-binding protein n=1 Tax=Nesterenkonia ebinurensis TaxID=2608252 RepID=UPI00123E12F2|nr:ABC transporter ATP-binding protein [Nesterenkonia ebinurensis]